MKKHRYFFIIIFLFLSLLLYVIRDDIKASIEHLISNFNKDKTVQVLHAKLEEENNIQQSEADTPGALKILNSTLGGQAVLSNSDVILLTNEERKKNGNLPALKENSILNSSAEKKLQDMFAKQYFEHISPNGVGVSSLAKESGYKYLLIGENLALGNFKNNQDLINAWMASPGHKANILNKNYTEIGVAVGKGNFDGQSVWMAVEHFGTPNSVCPLVDKVLYSTIAINQEKINEMSEDFNLRQDKIKNGVIYEGMGLSDQINEYNKLVNVYNNLLIETKQKVEEYNNQVKNFNACLYSYQ